VNSQIATIYAKKKRIRNVSGFGVKEDTEGAS
jgi:hypothetical protein